MLLTENIVQRVQNYDELKRFQVSTEWVTNIYSRIRLILSDIEISIDVEEQETYISFIIRQEKHDKVYIYYALSDYSYVSGEKRPLFNSIQEEKNFDDRVTQKIENHRKLFIKDTNGDDLVTCILSFLDDFVKSLP